MRLDDEERGGETLIGSVMCGGRSALTVMIRAPRTDHLERAEECGAADGVDDHVDAGCRGVAVVIAGGRGSDGLLEHVDIDPCIVVSAVSSLAMTTVFAPAAITTTLYVAAVLAVLAARFLSVAYPPLDAARPDVIVATMWARAVAVPIVLLLARGSDCTALATETASQPSKVRS